MLWDDGGVLGQPCAEAVDVLVEPLGLGPDHIDTQFDRGVESRAAAVVGSGGRRARWEDKEILESLDVGLGDVDAREGDDELCKGGACAEARKEIDKVVLDMLGEQCESLGIAGEHGEHTQHIAGPDLVGVLCVREDLRDQVLTRCAREPFKGVADERRVLAVRQCRKVGGIDLLPSVGLVVCAAENVDCRATGVDVELRDCLAGGLCDIELLGEDLGVGNDFKRNGLEQSVLGGVAVGLVSVGGEELCGERGGVCAELSAAERDVCGLGAVSGRGRRGVAVDVCGSEHEAHLGEAARECGPCGVVFGAVVVVCEEHCGVDGCAPFGVDGSRQKGEGKHIVDEAGSVDRGELGVLADGQLH
eukprot:comp21767_c0_seq1/m.48700 comp21767_c0_seq1/g.48700  ORF comp21767_c0_seq1/g.48700 comp21767_c0_seq1/m.48700 type:complete len:361 (+) comp21767_c0_seq1:126-1208(+)